MQEKLLNLNTEGVQMIVREKIEQMENENLSPYAKRSMFSKGREKDEAPCDIRTVYQRDRDRIIHCKSFRRLKHKTQVFLAPEGDHYRTRLTHTLEVSQIARTIAKALGLNEDLVEAICLGHDLGHTPYGHSGEWILNEKMKQYGLSFEHNKQSVRVVEMIERNGEGLNLTWEVRDGILNHGTDQIPSTLEGQVVRLSDKIAYINHDIDDAIRAMVLTEEMLPNEYTTILGTSVKDRLDRLIHDIIKNSMDQNQIIQSPDMAKAMSGLRYFMFEQVYKNPIVKAEEQKAQKMIDSLFTYYIEHISQLPEEYRKGIKDESQSAKAVVVCDYIAGMTDNYAVEVYQDLFIPQRWGKKK